MMTIIAAVLLQGLAPDSIPVRRRAPFVAPTVTAVRVAGTPPAPTIDGRLDDPAWTFATAITDLLQVDPDEGAPVSERTEVRLVYDAEALYVGVRLFDSDPRRIISRLGRRDAATHSDEFRLLLDSYHDHRTAFEFRVNAAGVKKDVLNGADGAYSDDSWDPVWEVATTVDSLGWTAELRIPFSQLRFSRGSDQVWGLRVARWIQRKNEMAMFPFVAKTETGLASRFADLAGIQDIAAPRRLELLPYVMGRGSYHTPNATGNPFDDGSAYFHGLGTDLKYGVSSNLTLDATVNPDFGQVEVDPAYVNLTAYEQELQERRPFFIEGGETFTFGGNGGGIVKFSDPPQYFYSRRIGHEPQGSTTSPGRFVDMPEQTTILGAAKLTGKRANGWSVGLLEAVTPRTWATVADTAGPRSRDEVEPLTNYLVGRLRRDLGRGNTTIGVLGTAVHRDLDVAALDELRTAAYVGGLDFYHRWGHNTYTIAASVGGSVLSGSSAAMQEAQKSSNRYYQRPDARSFAYDSTRTSLAGVSADLYLNKVAGTWNWSLGGGLLSPGFEVNDLGFQSRVDRRSAGAGVRRRWTHPGTLFRQAIVSLSHIQAWNYDGDPIQRSAALYSFGQFRNFWSGDLTFSYGARVLDDRLTRGGPLAAKPALSQGTLTLTTDDRKAASGYFYTSYYRTTAGSWSVTVLPQLTLRPAAGWSFSAGPDYFSGWEAAHTCSRPCGNAAWTWPSGSTPRSRPC